MSIFTRFTVAGGAIVLCCGLVPATVAFAQAQYEHCNAVLQGDLMNKVISNNTANSASRQVIRQVIFSKSADEAYEIYKDEVETAKKQGQKGSLGINYFGVGGNADFDINYSNMIGKSEFTEKFNKANQIYQNQSERIDESSTSLASAYASYVRDPNSIDAWKACVSREEQPGLYAFASRDDSDEPAINVVWAPGVISASEYPSITIEIGLPDGASISDPKREVAAGSGRTYRVTYPEQKRGFRVTVNGELRKDGELKNSFSTGAQVPPILDPSSPPVVAGPLPGPAEKKPDCTWGKNTCKPGFVWRLATSNDLVCVGVWTRRQTRIQNMTAASHQHRVLRPIGGHHPRPTARFACNAGYVTRNAAPGDNVCVLPSVIRDVTAENAKAEERIACR